MNIIKFHIKNYKSITDSKECYLEPDLTIFAGKNESGKTSILEAFETFNFGNEFIEEEKPISNKDAYPVISLTIEFTKEEINEYLELIGSEKKIFENIIVTITKSFPDKYLVDSMSEELLELSNNGDEISKLKKEINSDLQLLKNIHTQYILPVYTIDINNFNFPTSLDSGIAFLTRYQSTIVQNNYHNSYIPAPKNQQFLATLTNTLKKLEKLLKQEEEDNWVYFYEFLPNFILFKSFEDTIPNEVTLKDLQKNDFIKDIETISDLDTSIILSKNARDKIAHKKSVNLSLNQDYQNFWNQDSTSFVFDWDNENLLVFIEDGGDFYKPKERSKGKQWHLSFYTRVSARSIESKQNIILIDEPGMYLHAKAQEDIYNKLIDLSKNTQIIFTTHSPYLLKYNEMDRIRLVLKDANGSFINQKVHAGADKETLTPIMTAIGLELSQEIHAVDKIYNIVLEGPADFYYLQALKLVQNTDYNFIFGGGAGNMPYVGTILTGWGCNVLYAFDNDKGKKDGTKNLKDNWKVDNKYIISILEQEGSIEDLFSINDFKNYILQDKNANIKTKNSTYIKEQKSDKVLLSRKLLQFIRENPETKLSEETLKNYSSFLERAKKAFENTETNI